VHPARSTHAGLWNESQSPSDGDKYAHANIFFARKPHGSSATSHRTFRTSESNSRVAFLKTKRSRKVENDRRTQKANVRLNSISRTHLPSQISGFKKNEDNSRKISRIISHTHTYIYIYIYIYTIIRMIVRAIVSLQLQRDHG